MTKKLLLLLAVLALSLSAATSPGAAQPFQSGDTVCWVGDSITHGGSYHAIVELFYATRFPDRTIRYYNDGISGDRASAIMSDEKYRVNVDILAHKPTVAPIMLGMNDVNRNDYGGANQPGPELDQKHQRNLDIYAENMHKLMDTLTKAGARLILIEPSIYDETTTLPGAAANALGSNVALGKCSREIERWANEYHAGTVNFYGVMNEVNQREQKKDPNFTLVGKDRIHPGPIGHFVMAYAFLKAQGLPSEVSAIKIHAKKEKPGASVNASVSHVKKLVDGVEFDALEKSLPFVVPENAKPALDLVPFMQELNQEKLTVEGLGKGDFILKIDGEAAGQYTAAQLRAGINLSDNAHTPQYQQSAAANKISAARTSLGARIRDIAAQKYTLSRAKFDVFDNSALEKRMHEQIDAATAASKPVNKVWTAVIDDIAAPGKLMQQYDDLSVALQKATQPKEHHYVIERTTLTVPHDPSNKSRKGL